ncbi:hypothetical protein GYH30_000594 [Glycine max]|nr:hypothetical protein GYH30_000594 [Glycine max]
MFLPSSSRVLALTFVSFWPSISGAFSLTPWPTIFRFWGFDEVVSITTTIDLKEGDVEEATFRGVHHKLTEGLMGFGAAKEGALDGGFFDISVRRPHECWRDSLFMAILTCNAHS